ncbi:methyl-accepting chemotaxis protein [Clostridium sp. A1-XYC3]|uniref:Methyl-accepting chemotaxis protein n=1 Tax=Clostridium tanneri TaxID=3037988 RepID=A0ABU4JU93_9CLOT|nr:methyl-accepting chemotaxis protein [Clostridium sp. A1-XYC3]MDW8801718.1 methyl-accepting chemotaxis protein [Clostridium sp. A1-XYC3]
MKSIKNQLIFSAILLIIIPTLITNLIYSYYFSNNIKKNIIDNNKQLSSTIARSVKDFINKSYTLTQQMAQDKTTVDFNPEYQQQMLKKCLTNNSYFDLLYIQKTDGSQTARSSGELGNRANRWWFTQVMNDKKSFVSKSYYSVNGNTAVTSIFHPVLDSESNIIGIFGADIKLDSLQKLIENFGNGKDKYAFIIDSEGVVIAHPDKVQVSQLYNYKTLRKTVLLKDTSGNAIKDEKGNQKTQLEEIRVPVELKTIAEKALKGESGTAEYLDSNNVEVLSAYAPVSLSGDSKGWAVITVENKALAMSVVKATQVKIISIALLLLVIVSILVYILAGKFTKPIFNLTNLMQKASNGDLTVQSHYNSKSELGSLSANFNLMIAKIREFIASIQETSSLVASSSNSLVSTYEETAKCIEEISINISQVALSAEDQAASAVLGLETTAKLSEEITVMTSYMDEGKNSADTIYRVSSKGAKVIFSLEEVTEENNKVINHIVEVINSLNEKTNTIGTIADTITSISEETNLLALNAAIEAARAGDSGKGFAVVADEVRKLSESTALSSSSVKELISNIQKDIITAQNTIQSAESIVAKHNDAVSYTKDTFTEISSNIQEVVNKINTTAESLDTVILSRNQLLSSIDVVSKASKDMAMSSQQVSAITEEETASVQTISNLAKELSSMAERLEVSLKTFKIN